ncbi:putative short-chain dehydrogenase [Escherichia coli]|uniref:Putative short-chain dehydrogenase n=1 Tax=Escherichia coli TaxID=562 RepID=A0A376KQX3_ECOLX|nr:putative short-chain dehydrogenase [Escherichia coli]
MRLLPPPIRGSAKECALLLAQQGFDIGITWHSDEEGAKDTAREVVSHGVRAEIVQLDLGKLPEGAQALEKLIQRLGRIDVLVNNAGAMTKAPFLDMAFDEWRKIFTVDVDGAFFMLTNCGPPDGETRAGWSHHQHYVGT